MSGIRRLAACRRRVRDMDADMRADVDTDMGADTAADTSAGSDAGFTVLEMLTSFVVFAIAAASATAAIANSMKVSNSTDNRVTATGLAAAAIHQARADTTSLIADPDTTTTTGAYTVTREATVPEAAGIRCPAGETIAVTVTVTWRDGGNREVRVDTEIAC